MSKSLGLAWKIQSLLCREPCATFPSIKVLINAEHERRSPPDLGLVEPCASHTACRQLWIPRNPRQCLFDAKESIWLSGCEPAGSKKLYGSFLEAPVHFLLTTCGPQPLVLGWPCHLG